jgi:hypothetical protein
LKNVAQRQLSSDFLSLLKFSQRKKILAIGKIIKKKKKKPKMEGIATGGAFVLTILLHLFVMTQSYRYRAWSGLWTLLWLVLGSAFVIFVWLHFYWYAQKLTADGDGTLPPPQTLLEEIRLMLRKDVIVAYFEEFSTDWFLLPAARYWTNEVRNLALVQFFWIGFEGRRQGMGVLSRVGWVLFAFLGTLAGCFAMWVPMLPLAVNCVRGEHLKKKPGSLDIVSFTWLHLALLPLLAFVLTLLYASWNNDLMNAYMLISMCLPLLPVELLSRKAAGAEFQRWHVLASCVAFMTYNMCDRLFNWVAVALPHWQAAVATHYSQSLVTTVGMIVRTAFDDIYHAAIANDVIFGTASGEVINVTVMLIVFMYLNTRSLVHVAQLLATFLLTGAGGALAYAIFRRELAIREHILAHEATERIVHNNKKHN